MSRETPVEAYDRLLAGFVFGEGYDEAAGQRLRRPASKAHCASLAMEYLNTVSETTVTRLAKKAGITKWEAGQFLLSHGWLPGPIKGARHRLWTRPAEAP